MTDHELIAYLKRQGLDKDIAAANRIEELVKEQARLHAGWHEANVNKLIAKLKLDKAVEALRVALEGLNWAKAYLSTSGIDSVPVNYADATVYAVLAELEGK